MSASLLEIKLYTEFHQLTHRRVTSPAPIAIPHPNAVYNSFMVLQPRSTLVDFIGAAIAHPSKTFVLSHFMVDQGLWTPIPGIGAAVAGPSVSLVLGPCVNT